MRRVPARELDETSDPVLLEAIRAEIRATGPMTFARFMQIALYDPVRGYYRAAAPRPGREGDFLTSPEAHPIFGRAIARLVSGIHAALGAPPTLTIRESGAGVGALAEPLVESLLTGPTTAGPRPARIRYLVDEVDPRRVDALRERLSRLALPAGAAIEAGPDTGEPIDGVAIANEVLDALPVHRVVQRDAALREVFVGITEDGGLVDVEGEPSTPALGRRLVEDGASLRDGQRAEICLEIDPWVGRAAAGLRNGLLLVIDYGHPAAELYDGRRRPAGTLATYQGHRVGEDPYRAIGRQDLTTHVDLTALTQAAERAGLRPAGMTTQASFLAALGLGDLLVAEQTRPGATLQTYLDARSAAVRMIDPAAMGGFRVVAFDAGSTSMPPLPGSPVATAPMVGPMSSTALGDD